MGEWLSLFSKNKSFTIITISSQNASLSNDKTKNREQRGTKAWPLPCPFMKKLSTPYQPLSMSLNFNVITESRVVQLQKEGLSSPESGLGLELHNLV
jgi:hypothetical protein